MTMTLVSTVTLATSATTITFSDIPQTGKDLVIVFSARVDASSQGYVGLKLNNSVTGAIAKRLSGTGSVTGSDDPAYFVGAACISTDTANTFASNSIYLPNYSIVGKKSASIDAVRENNATSSELHVVAYTLTSTDVISSIVLSTYSGSFVANSTASLYTINTSGIAPAIAKATGGTITSDLSYIYHTFTASGTFTPTVPITADVLTIAGGGAGQYGRGGGGGAGGLAYLASQALSTAQSVVIGGGGGGSNTSTLSGTGSNSTFGALAAANGGGRGNSGGNGGNGGSGGGGGASGSIDQTGGAGSQGFAGGGALAATTGNRTGGGGGGTGAIGGQGGASTNVGGAGGTGTSTYSSWLSAISSIMPTAFQTATSTGRIAGGGGGGASTPGLGGSGGGSDGLSASATTDTLSGIANTGSGSGGSNSFTYFTGNGGSGIVIVRYPR